LGKRFGWSVVANHVALILRDLRSKLLSIRSRQKCKTYGSDAIQQKNLTASFTSTAFALTQLYTEQTTCCKDVWGLSRSTQTTGRVPTSVAQQQPQFGHNRIL